MRIGVYGGSFNPIHFGHLLLAETARDVARLDRVDFIPSGALHYGKLTETTREDRYQMLCRALRPYRDFNVNRMELDNPELAYTYDTLRKYREDYPDDEIFLILSSESANKLPTWYNAEGICKLANLIVARRGGYPPPNFELYEPFLEQKRIDLFRELVVDMPLFDLSSTELRERIAKGRSIRFLTPDAVVEYIVEKKIYTDHYVEASAIEPTARQTVTPCKCKHFDDQTSAF